MGSISRAWVFAGGDFSVSDVNLQEVSSVDRIICVDKGVEYCLSVGLSPTLLVGDFDSIDAGLLARQDVSGIPRSSFPREKAASDLELALKILSEDPPDEVVVFGVSGGRTDHMLFNWLLPALSHWSFKLQYRDSTSRCDVLQGPSECQVEVSPGRTLSLVALSEALGVTTQGMAYPLENATLNLGSTLGLSNVAERCNVSAVSYTHLTLPTILLV